MAITRLGYDVPNDMPTYSDDDTLDGIYNDQTGMEYVLHVSTYDPRQVIIEACHEDVGLVTYYRADSYDEAVTECNSIPAHLTSHAYRPYEPTAVGTNQTSNLPPIEFGGIHSYPQH